ncbi:hypothetical protein ACFFTN_13710 [Aminobacter aganoensis]|uniref:Uncharacterized protein n=1 Tax=Aminobacter aganoensis TaxID=83264 RepID=A0A7X0FDA3_9HYPH|nr:MULTISPECIES: hypothetical protein [Aminobacter]MBB6357338.1 hypothetical protein [Aminobacter aganoensis]
MAPTTTEGTALKWIGAAAGTLCYFGCPPGGTADMSGGGIYAVQFDGNLLASKSLHLRSCSFSIFQHVRCCNVCDNITAYCMIMDSEARPGVNSMYRCNSTTWLSQRVLPQLMAL